MNTPAKARDLLDLRTGRHAAGYLVHSGCGGRVAWSLLTDGAACRGCGERWAYDFLLDRDNAKGSPELYKWQPPVEVCHEFIPR